MQTSRYALDIAPDDAPTRRPDTAAESAVTRAAAHAESGEWRPATREIDAAATLAPLSASGWLLAARCYAACGYDNLAASARDRVLRSGPHSPDVYAGLYAEFKRVGEHHNALEVCRRAVKASPDDHAAHFAMAHTMAVLGYAATYVAAVLETTARLAPDNPIYRVSTAIHLVKCARLEEAYEHLRAAPVERLESLTCRCSVRSLLSLCVWAKDAPRTLALGRALSDPRCACRSRREDETP